MAYIGKSVRRDEDFRFLRGRGRFVDDLKAPDALWAAFVRSPHAHARIGALDIADAAAMLGVVAVLTGADWAAEGYGEMPCLAPENFSDGRPMNEALRPVFSTQRVRHVGEPVAMVVAETRDRANDAAEAVAVEYDALAAVAHPLEALAPEAPVLHQGFGTNLCQHAEYGDRASTDAAFARAAHVSRVKFRNGRVSPTPMEPRAYLAEFDSGRERMTLWATAQAPHLLQRALAQSIFRIPLSKVRVVSPDVGGGFGTKFYVYPEPPALLWASRRLGHPVRWTATRAEALANDTHARDIETEAEMAFDADGRILALRCRSTAAYGAYLSTFAPQILCSIYARTLTGPYAIPAAHATVDGVYTNTAPIDAYRGVKQAPNFVHERLIERGAQEMKIDSAEIRLRNYIRPDVFPYTNAFGSTYDSGDSPRQHETLRGIVDLDGLRVEQAVLRARDIRLGIGWAAVQETAGMGPSRLLASFGTKVGGWESARVEVHADGRATLWVGTHSHGQGHEITFRQIVADGLRIPIEHVEFTQGDTDLGPGNFGTGAARALSTAGMGLVEASRRVVEKARRLAAHVMECALEDVSHGDGRFEIAGTDRSVRFDDVAALAFAGADYPDEDFELGLDAMVFHDPPAFNHPTALHLAVVLVDEETGRVTLRDFAAVDDCGTIVNPMVVEGQVHGGAAQGIGQAMLERIVYDGEGQLLSGSFMDYAMPRADDLPSFRTAFQCTPSPTNVLGVKGGSEAGTVGPPAAILHAIEDALADLEIRGLDMPYTPERVWRAIRAASAGDAA